MNEKHMVIDKINKVSKCFYCGCEGGEGRKELRPYGPNGADICFDCVDNDSEKDKLACEVFCKMLKKSAEKTGMSMLTEEGPISYIGKV